MVLSIIIFILTLLVLVVIHEFGHFLMAKRFGIKVEEFGFGIPPRVWGKRIGETIYSLNWLPLGGFVRLLGEDSVNKKVLQNPRSFASQNVYKRILVVVAGVTMNLVLAWLLFYSVIIYQNFRIIYPTLEPAAFVGFVEKDFPAEKAGIKVGDRIFKVDGKQVVDPEQAISAIKGKKGAPVSLTITDMNGNNPKQIEIAPKKADGGDYLIGVGFSPFAIKQYNSVTEKIFSGITYSADFTRFTLSSLAIVPRELFRILLGHPSNALSGPVGLGGASTQILSGGAQNLPIYVWFVGVISLTLAIFNVLPIPALDGGRLLFLVIEAVTKKKVKEEVESMVHQIGFIVLIALAILVTYSDIRKLLP